MKIVKLSLVLVRFLYRIRNCLTQLYAKDITPDDKQELDEALQREVNIKTRGISINVVSNCHDYTNFLFVASAFCHLQCRYRNAVLDMK